MRSVRTASANTAIPTSYTKLSIIRHFYYAIQHQTMETEFRNSLVLNSLPRPIIRHPRLSTNSGVTDSG